MFELTNDQRTCFGLSPVGKHWQRIEAKQSPCDDFGTYLYLDGDVIVKCVMSSQSLYCEYELNEQVSSDQKFLLPKTGKGKPVVLSSSTIQKRNGIGMRLCYSDGCISLYNEKTECSYFSNRYLDDGICSITDFAAWVENWCIETTEDDIKDILRFSQEKRKHIRYQEGDVFRFKIGRRYYGYGRILLDYDKMRKKKQPFWDILMSKPLVCSVYHIVTQRRDLTAEELKSVNSLPSSIIADNGLYYGEYSIIGNIPVTEAEDYPIMYGRSISVLEDAVCYQQGKVFRKIENGTALYDGFRHNGVCFDLNFTLEILMKCIEEKSNDPYWQLYYPHWVNSDLRNPENADKLMQIKKQFDLQ